ncbi:integrase/recombinase xerD homolog [Argopecten irradians]|uniref:integrase/recombinase xerD homolog n=1 Tax=Argopecten irradians TaxID=31199 RepID=UPI0037141964
MPPKPRRSSARGPGVKPRKRASASASGGVSVDEPTSVEKRPRNMTNTDDSQPNVRAPERGNMPNGASQDRPGEIIDLMQIPGTSHVLGGPSPVPSIFDPWVIIFHTKKREMEAGFETSGELIIKDGKFDYPLTDVRDYIAKGFNEGFSLEYVGPRRAREAGNLASTKQAPEILQGKIKKELEAGRIAGPFAYPPLPTLQVSPFHFSSTVGQVSPVSPSSRTFVHPNTCPPMGDIKVEANRLLQNAMANSTWKTYNSALQCFQTFRSSYNMSSIWPVPSDHLVQFISYMSLQGYSASTISTYMSGISHEHNLRGQQDSTQCFIVKKIMEGAQRGNKRVDARLPITLPLIRKLVTSLSSVCSSKYEAELFSAAFTLAFFGFLRVGEFSASSSNGNDTRPLGISDVTIVNSPSRHLKVCIRESKTDQRGHSALLHINSYPNSDICPVSLLNKYLLIRPNTVNQQLFIHRNGSSITRYQVAAVLKKSLTFSRIPVSHYKTHSFRIGAATEAATRGISEQKIQAWGRWKSRVYSKYIRIPVETVFS